MSEKWIAVLSGGLSHEREVSLRSGRRLSAAVRSTGITVQEWDADADLIGKISEHRPDAVVVALHGGQGENGSIQTVLEMLSVPFVGSDSDACRRAWDKPIAKTVLRDAGLATPDWVVLPHSTFRELGAQAVLDAMVDKLGLPLVLKPNQGGSALGVQVVTDATDLPAAMMACFAYGDTVLAEKYVTGTEVAVTVLDLGSGPEALPAVEIAAETSLYDYTARYTAGLTDFHTPARLSDDVLAKVAEVAVHAHRVLGLRDLSRTDAIVTHSGEVQFLEVNVSPGLTETSLLPMAVEAAGHSMGEIFSTLIERATKRATKRHGTDSQ